MNGYQTKEHACPVKRYCQTMDMKNDPELIRKYIKVHDKFHHWLEIREGIRSVGILEMEIYMHGNRLFMIVETPLDFEWETAMTRLATLPRQAEWEDYVAVFQDCQPGDAIGHSHPIHASALLKLLNFRTPKYWGC